MHRSEIILKNCQIKSLEKARKVAKLLSLLEEETGIRETRITLDGLFICPWIDLAELNKTEMEIVLRDIILKIT